MNTDELNNTLVSLETNLKDLLSAREQVEIVTKSSDNLVHSTEKLLNSIDRYSGKADKYFSKNILQFSEIIDNYKLKHEELISFRENNIHNDIKEFRKTTTNLVSGVKNSINGINDANNIQLSEFDEKLDKILTDSKKDINKNIEEFKQTTNYLTSEVEKSITGINEANDNQLSEFDKRLGKIITDSKNDIDKNIEEFKLTTQELKSSTKNEINEIKDVTIALTKKLVLEIEESLSTYKDINDQQNLSFINFQKKMDEKFEFSNQEIKSLNKKQNIFSIVTWVIIVGGFLYLAF